MKVARLLEFAEQYLRPGASLDVWQKCNIQCVFCPSAVVPEVTPPLRWTAETVRKIFSVPGQLSSVYFAGSFGEPVLNPELPDIVRIFARNGAHVGVSSNGQALTTTVATRLIEAGVGSFNISTVGLDRTVTEKYMQGINYEMTVRNIQDLTSLTRVRKVGLSIAVVGVLEAIRNLSYTLQFAAKHGIKEVKLLSILDRELSLSGKQENPEYRAFIEENRLSRDLESFREVWRNAKSCAEALGIDLSANNPYRGQLECQSPMNSRLSGHPGTDLLLSGRSRLCLEPFVGAIITWDASVVPCCSETSQPVGNLVEHPMADIWNRGVHREVREGLLSGNLHSMCRHCTRAPRASADLMKLVLAVRTLQCKFHPSLVWYTLFRRKNVRLVREQSLVGEVPVALLENLSNIPGYGREFLLRLRSLLSGMLPRLQRKHEEPN